ncbi:MAG: hypothetical protein LBD50_00835 [Rickettsiales bacterium]|nr:hypothetical protein [Rickettsiales bacterium]
MKPRYKRRLFWSCLSFAAIFGLAVILAPPFISLDKLKPKIEASLAQQTGMAAKINGNVNFSLLGGAKIVIHDVALENGRISSALISVPMSGLLNLDRAPLSGKILIHGANFNISGLTPPAFENEIVFRHSTVNFMGRDFEIIQGALSNGLLRGIVRVNGHKYEFNALNGEFHISNKNNLLNIFGTLYSDGSARGRLLIDTKNINELFEFKEPMVRKRVKLSSDFEWNGGRGFKFHNIQAENFSGNIELFDNGHRKIELRSDNLDFDFSFLLGRTGIFDDTEFNLDFRGNLKIANKIFKHIKIDALGTIFSPHLRPMIQIRSITADDMVISGGAITENGAENMHIQLDFGGRRASCVFSGAPEDWNCSEFKYGDISGSFSVKDGRFEAFISSDKKMPDIRDLREMSELIGYHGNISFQFSDIGGDLHIDKKQSVPSYKFARNKNLNWLGRDLHFMPKHMMGASGDFYWDDEGMHFEPHSKRWKLSAGRNSFYLTGKNARDWLPGLDLQSINDFEYEISGNYMKGSISNLEIKIAGHTFRGAFDGDGITLETDLLNIDSFISQDFIDDYEELQFLSNAPILLPFSFGLNISLSADALIYNGEVFKNFVYVLKSGAQSFSITDSLRGNLLAAITKKKNKYDVRIQLNKFAISGGLLSSGMPANLANTMITGRAELSTFGQIAYDIWYNLAGSLDMSFEGGEIIGLGTDGFYEAAQKITTLNSESLLASALDGGLSKLKNLRIVGEYENGNFATTEPFILSMRHTDATGDLQIKDGRMAARINLVLRGTSPDPAPISIIVQPDGGRGYSLSQIMIDFDPDFFRDFVATHGKF